MSRRRDLRFLPDEHDYEQRIPPETEIDALMQARPNEEPRWSKERLLPVREVIVDAMDLLTEREQWIVHASVIERKSLRTIGEELSLSKTHVDRIKASALAKLAEMLGDEPLVKELLCR